MTRGHSSNIGTANVIGLTTGKVLDSVTQGKKCKGCDWWVNHDKTSNKYAEWKARHKCTVTHTGSSGSMEAVSTVTMFARSVEKNSLRYTGYIGDGDTSSFNSVLDSNPYGELKIHKKECVGHVQKRMGTRLRKLKDSLKGRKLSDGKTIGGKGRLTDVKIDQITSYYDWNAIRANKGNLTKLGRQCRQYTFITKLRIKTHHITFVIRLGVDICKCQKMKDICSNTKADFLLQ